MKTNAAPTVFALILGLLVGPGAVEAKKKKAKGKKSSSATHAEVEGVVRAADDEGKTLSGVIIRLDAAAGGVIEAVSGDGGRFELSIPDAAGTYTIRLESSGYAPFATEVPLEAGQRYSYDFKLIDATTGLRQQAIETYNEGAKLYQEGDMAGAKANFESALSMNAEMHAAHLGLANVHLNAGDLPAARRAIEAFRAADPEESNARRLAFEIYMRQGDIEEMRALAEAFRDGPEAANLAAQIYNEGVAAMSDENDARAVSFFDLAHTLAPDLAEPLTGKATLQYNAEDYVALEATLAQLEAAAPNHGRLHRLRFLLHDARQETDAALVAFDAYHAVDGPAALELLLTRADLDFRESRPAAARDALQRIVALEPDHARAHYTLGLALASLGDNAGARTHLQRFLELAPDDPEGASVREMLPHLGG